MASSYPGAVDALTNPTATDAMNSVTVPHATQHANANDAIEAIQTELGTDPAGASATVKARLDTLDTTVSGKAPAASPTFTGTVTTPLSTAGYVKTTAGGVLSSSAAVLEADVTGLTTALGKKATTAGVFFSGTAGNNISCADAAGLDITGDIEIVARVSATDWTPAAQLVIAARTTLADPNRGWFFAITTAGELRLVWYPTGSAASGITKTSTVATGFTDGDVKWVKVTLDVDNGAVGNDVKFYTAADSVTEPSSWTQLGTTVTTAAVTSLPNIAAGLQFAYTDGGVAYSGKAIRLLVRNGIGGTLVASPDFSTPCSPRLRDAQGNVWTLNGSAWAWEMTV